MLRAEQPDVVLIGICSDQTGSIQLAAQMIEMHADLPVIVISPFVDETSVCTTLSAGVAGYLLAKCAERELELAVKSAVAGGAFLSSSVRKQLANYIQKTREDSGALLRLRERQREILELIAEGISTKEISYVKLSRKTVEAHRANLMDRLGIHDVAGLVRFAMQQGIVKMD